MNVNGRVHSSGRRSAKALIAAAALSIFAVSCLRQEPRIAVSITGVERSAPVALRSPDTDYREFSHAVPEHREQACDMCHGRRDASTDLSFPGHASCTACHFNEFTSAGSKMCAICHDDLKAVPASVRRFPERFTEGFNMIFDHAAHLEGDALPEQGCAACHRPLGAALSIPAGQSAHATCFTCHTPESKVGSCSVCHDLAPYRRTPASSVVFKEAFSHADHAGERCSDCHVVRAGEPQGRQVASPVAVQHFSAGGATSCRTCHNDVRAFGQRDFSNCRRCHGGPGFDMIPGRFR